MSGLGSNRLTVDQDQGTSGTRGFLPAWHFIPFLFIRLDALDRLKRRSTAFWILDESTRHPSGLVGSR
jgi:hypothetical protein